MTSRTRAMALLSLVSGALLVEPAPRAYAGPPAIVPLMTKPLHGAPAREVVVMTVEYAPGESDPVHRHHAQAFVYVLEGTVEMQLKGGPLVKLGPGQTFYEGPDDVHIVGRNASDTRPAKFLVVLVKDQGAPVLVPE